MDANSSSNYGIKLTNVAPSKSTTTASDRDRRGVRVKFYRNGDAHFKGFEFNFCRHNYKKMDNLLDQLNASILCDQTILPYGIRVIFTVSGKKVNCVNDLKDGCSYVVSSSNTFVNLQYENIKLGPFWRHLPTPISSASQRCPVERKASESYCKAQRKRAKDAPARVSCSQESNQGKVLHIVRNDVRRPREIYNWLINNKTAPHIEKVLSDLSSLLAMERGRLKKLVSSDGTTINSMRKLHEKANQLMFAFGNESYTREDMKLSKEEKLKLHKISSQKIFKVENMKDDYVDDELSGMRFQYFLPSHLEVSDPVLWSSAYAVVKKCYDFKSKAAGFLKVIDLRKCNKDERSIISKEIFLMKYVKQPFIISMTAHYSNDFFHMLVFDKTPETTLVEAVLNSTHHCERFISDVVFGLSSALNYLHNCKIVLRHLTIDNIIASKDNKKLNAIRVCDFSLAKTIRDGKKLSEICGSPFYVSPEMLMEVGYDCKIDCWSLGIILCLLFHGRPPHGNISDNHNDIFSKIVSEKVDFSSSRWNHVSGDAKCFLKVLLTRNPISRLSSPAILKHSWIRNRSTKTSEHDIKAFVDLDLRSFVERQKSLSLAEHHPLVSTRLDNEAMFFVADRQGNECGDGGRLDWKGKNDTKSFHESHVVKD